MFRDAWQTMILSVCNIGVLLYDATLNEATFCDM